MAISYFKSSQVHVFPCAYRGTSAQNAIDPEARLNTEKNLTNTGNNLKGTYLISKTTSGTVTKVNIVIGGYYFELTMDTSVSGNITWDSLKNKYLAIKLASPDLTAGYQTKVLANYSTGLSGYLDEDTNNTFLGLAICETDTEAAEATAKIKIADNNGSILNDAYLPDISSSTGSKSLASSGCTAAGDYATAFGKGLVGTNVAGQMVIGSYNTNTNANDKIFIVGNGTTEGTRSDAFTVGTDGSINANNKFTVATNGNTAIAGTLGVTGATTLTSATLSSTLAVTGTSTFTGAATFNGTSTFNDNVTISSHDLTVTGDISCANLEAGQQVKCEGLSVGQIGSESDDILLGKTLLPGNNVNLGSGSNLFTRIYSKRLYLYDTSSAKYLDIKYDNSKWNIYASTTTSFLSYTGDLTIGRDSGATAEFKTNSVTFNKGIIATENIQANGGIKIASGKHLDLSGSSTGSIKLRGETTTGSTSYAVVGNGIYNITFKSNSESAPNSTYSVTMALVIPSTASLLDSTIYSSEVYRNGQYGWQIKAVHGTYGWTLTFTSGGNSASCNWFVTKIADVA